MKWGCGGQFGLKLSSEFGEFRVLFSAQISTIATLKRPIRSLPCSSIKWCDTFKILTEQIMIRHVFNVQNKATCCLNALGKHTLVSSANVNNHHIQSHFSVHSSRNCDARLNFNVLSCCHVIGWLTSCGNKQPNNLPPKKVTGECVFNN